MAFKNSVKENLKTIHIKHMHFKMAVFSKLLFFCNFGEYNIRSRFCGNTHGKEDYMRRQMEIGNLFDLNCTIASDLFDGCQFPWEVLPKIKGFILELGATLPEDKFEKKGEDIWISKTAKVAPTASITGPCIIDDGAEIRHCAFIRGSAIIGKNSVVGNSAEIKNAVIFDNVQVPHYNYIGDSVLGTHSHFGAGAVTSNVKSDRTLVTVKGDGEQIETGLKKFGAMVGDWAEIGCNAVLCPGTIIGRNTTVYPLVCVRGLVPSSHIVKGIGNIVLKK